MPSTPITGSNLPFGYSTSGAVDKPYVSQSNSNLITSTSLLDQRDIYKQLVDTQDDAEWLDFLWLAGKKETAVDMAKKQLDALGVKYELGNEFKPFKVIYKPTGQSDEFYYFSKIFRTQYSEFMQMPTYARKYLINKHVEEIQNQ